MITKEKERYVANKKIKTNQEKNIENNKKWNWAIVGIIFLFVIFSFIVLYVFRIKNMSIYNPYETKIIKVKSEKKEWHLNDNINLFKTTNSKGEKIIYPGETGKYDFIIENVDMIPIYYKISISDDNKNNINMKYKLKQNNVYVVGNEDVYENIEKLNLQEIKIMEKAKALYTLEWKWEETEKDLELGKQGLATYRIYIDIYSKYSGELYESN